jgi:hypothetical protein
MVVCRNAISMIDIVGQIRSSAREFKRRGH